MYIYVRICSDPSSLPVMSWNFELQTVATVLAELRHWVRSRGEVKFH